jgi:hypothetical protein
MEPVTRLTLIKGVASFVAMTMNRFVVEDVIHLSNDFGGTRAIKALIIFFIFFNGSQNFKAAFYLTVVTLLWLSLLRTRKEQLQCPPKDEVRPRRWR